MSLTINERDTDLKGFVLSLPRTFDSLQGEVMRDARNTVKCCEINGRRIVIKRYGRLTAFNRLVYGTIRRSKSKRAYLYAQRLLRMGFNTPAPIASYDVRRRGLLDKSYFVCEYTDYIPLNTVMGGDIIKPEVREVLNAFVEYAVRLHNAGIMHRDFNTGNILFKKIDGRYDFTLIDINRMYFRRKLKARERLENMERLTCDGVTYMYILSEYTKHYPTDVSRFELWGAVKRLSFDYWRAFLKVVKKPVKFMTALLKD